MSLDLLEMWNHELFPEVDLALRSGTHIHDGQLDLFAFVREHLDALREFYDRYGCDLIHSTHGFFYLLPHGDSIPPRALSKAQMVVGMGLCLAWLDPAVRAGREVLTEEVLLERLGAHLGRDRLTRILQRGRKYKNAVAEGQQNRKKLRKALRELERLGFVRSAPGAELVPSPAVLRFAELVHGDDRPEVALTRLLEQGRVVESEESLEHSDELSEDEDTDELEGAA